MSLGAKPGLRRGKNLLSGTSTSDQPRCQGRGHVAATPLHTTSSPTSHLLLLATSSAIAVAAVVVHMPQPAWYGRNWAPIQVVLKTANREVTARTSYLPTIQKLCQTSRKTSEQLTKGATSSLRNWGQLQILMEVTRGMEGQKAERTAQDHCSCRLKAPHCYYMYFNL